VLDSDRGKYPLLASTHEDMPLLDEEDNLNFMVKESGLRHDHCRAVFCEQWPNEVCVECGAPPLLQVPIRSATLILPVVLNTQVVWTFGTAELMRDEMARVVAAAL